MIRICHGNSSLRTLWPKSWLHNKENEIKKTIDTGPINEDALIKACFGDRPEKEFVLLKQYMKDREAQTALRLDIPMLSDPRKSFSLSYDYLSRGRFMKNNLWISGNPKGASKEWDHKIEQHFQPYISIWESEICYMAGLAARWGCIETGGEVYGLISHAGRPVIVLATPPGPNSVHESAQFRQDMAFFQKVNAFLRNKFGIFYLGSEHNHHLLGINRPSRVDIQSTNSIAQRNGFRRLVQFILTFEKRPTAGLHRFNGRLPGRSRMHWTGESEVEGRYLSEIYARGMGRFQASRQLNFIRIRSFFFPDAAPGGPVQCPIQIIPGTSPFRRALVRNSMIPELTIPYCFPMSRILFESVKLQEPAQHVPELPEWISKQCSELPRDVRKNISVVIKDGLVIFSFPLPLVVGTAFVAFNQKPPHELQGIYFSQPGKEDAPNEISLGAFCLGGNTGNLGRIYKGVVRLAKGEGLAGRPEKLIRNGEIGNSQEGGTGEQGAAYGEED